MDTCAYVQRRASAGFTVIEVIIALVILTGGILAMAGSTALIVRQISLAEANSDRAFALQSTVERLRGRDFDLLVDGTQNVGPFAVSWVVTGSPPIRTVDIIMTGPGLTGSPPTPTTNFVDTFTYKVVHR